MQIPAILYGDAKEVRARCKAALRAWLSQEVPYIAVMEAGGMLNVSDIATPLTLEYGPREQSFGLFLAAPTFLLLGPKGLLMRGGTAKWWHSPRITEFFDASLTRPWGLLSIVDTQNSHGLLGPEDASDLDRYRRLIASVLRDCSELEAVGPRYSGGALWPSYLARHVHKVYIGLRLLGVPMDRLNAILGPYRPDAPEPPGGLRGILRELGAWIDPAWAAERLPDQPSTLVPQAPPPYNPLEHEMSDRMRAAMLANDPVTVQQLIETGESIDATGADGIVQTPLLWAAGQGHTDLVRFLLDHSSDIEDRSYEGESPLMLAAFHGKGEMVQLLLDRGADRAYRTDKGWDAVMFAELGKHAELAALLQQAQDQHETRRNGHHETG